MTTNGIAVGVAPVVPILVGTTYNELPSFPSPLTPFVHSSITYPAISAFVSMHADADQQGLVQGMITGMRGLCNGLGPAMFGLIFNLFNVNLMEQPDSGVYGPDGGGGGGAGGGRPPIAPLPAAANSSSSSSDGGVLGDEDFGLVTQIVPGPPFVFGALLVILALMVSAFIPESFQVVTLLGIGAIGFLNQLLRPLNVSSRTVDKPDFFFFFLQHLLCRLRELLSWVGIDPFYIFCRTKDEDWKKLKRYLPHLVVFFSP